MHPAPPRSAGLARRLILTLGAAVTVLLGAASAWSIHAEAERIDAAYAARAQARLAELVRIADRVRVAAGLEAARQAVRATAPGAPLAVLLPRGAPLPEPFTRDDGLLLGSAVPVGAAVPEARLYTWTPPSRRRHAVRQMLLERGGVALGLLLLLVAAVVGVIRRRVGGPVQALLAQVDRVAEGDWSGTVSVRRGDELGRLSARFNAMLASLRETRAALEAESHRRVQAVDALRHAQRLRTLGQLTAGIAHELGTPLNVVKGRARLIERDRLDAAQRMDSARIIGEQCECMAGLVRQLLSFARREGPPDAVIDVAAASRSIAALVEPALRKRQVTLTLDLPEAPVWVQAEHNHLEQVLTNLVFNAADAMPDGGPVTVRVAVVDDATVRCAVSDEGTGMPPEVAEQIFEPFFTTKELGRGTGLGLAVVHGIVDDLGGRVEVASAAGEGTQMRVYLPRASAAAEGSPGAGSPGPGSAAGVSSAP